MLFYNLQKEILMSMEEQRLNKIHEWADKQINSAPLRNRFTLLMAEEPYTVNNEVWQGFSDRHSIIKEFMQTSLELFKTAIINGDKILTSWLINEAQLHLGLDYHKELINSGSCHWKSPVFYRIDESSTGKIMEIQCPGSLWGELQLAYDYFVGEKALVFGLSSPVELFSKQLTDYLGRQPIVHHLLDDSKSQSGMRYFIAKTMETSSPIKYYGIGDIEVQDCNFVRAHLLDGLCGESNFSSRVKENDIVYDLPPITLFSQKAALVLPFWSLTKKYYSDNVRSIINFSTPLLPNGIEMPNGDKLSVPEFSVLSRQERSYFLKYAGAKSSENWGSKSVYRLSNLSSTSCEKLLRECLEDFNKGCVWLLQKEDTVDDEVTYFTRANGCITEKMRLKINSFYGDLGFIGALSMHNKFYKVTGAKDSVISLIAPEIKI
jgi:hypothetical protein